MAPVFPLCSFTMHQKWTAHFSKKSIFCLIKWHDLLTKLFMFISESRRGCYQILIWNGRNLFKHFDDVELYWFYVHQSTAKVSTEQNLFGYLFLLVILGCNENTHGKSKNKFGYPKKWKVKTTKSEVKLYLYYDYLLVLTQTSCSTDVQTEKPVVVSQSMETLQ